MRPRLSPLFLPAALASVLLLAGAPRTASAQVTLPYEVELDYNSDTTPGVDDNAGGYPGGDPNGPYTARYESPTNVVTVNNANLPLIYLAPDATEPPPGPFTVVRPFPPAPSGARLVVRPQDDPYIIFNLTIQNATDSGQRQELTNAFPFTSLTLQLDPFVSPPGQLPFQFLADNEGPPAGDFRTSSSAFNSFSLSGDRRTLTFFDIPVITGPSVSPFSAPVGSTFTVNFRLSAPFNPNTPALGINILPNQAGIPEPGTLALLAAGLPLAACLRRRARSRRGHA